MKKFLLFILFFASFSASAEEAISDYDVTLTVRPDASVVVTEKITVNVEGIKIRRGIYRDLPKTKGVKYHVLHVKRNNKTEPFFTETQGKFLRINTGSDELLPRNTHQSYEISYVAENVILGFDDYDELYWNVTGNGWDFPIERASARVILPDGARIKQFSTYQGRTGSKEPAGYQASPEKFYATRFLQRKEGLTIAVGFDKGFVNIPPPPFYKKIPFQSALRFSIGVLLAYLVISWALYGKDPEKDAVMPRFDTPADLTPAQACWIYSYGKTAHECMTLALLQGGVSGFLKITETDDFHLTELRDPENGEEKFIKKNLGLPTTFSKKYSQKMGRFLEKFSIFMKQKTADRYFATNRLFVVLAFLLLIGLTAYQCLLADLLPMAMIMTFYLLFLIPMGTEITKIFATGKFRWGALLSLIFIVLHFSSFVFTFIMENRQAIDIIKFYAIGILAILIYAHLIIRPTRKGMQVIAHIDGIKMFLKAIDMPGEVNFDKMEKLLPYAVFLGLADEWEKKMNILTVSSHYSPSWYSGRRFRCHSFCSGFSSTLSSSCVRPRRSGSGGGGFSGGGFGGGGGGGR
ncbi:MAG: DUF2207 domain-containing protein [Alphaproteobacteria bacterium]|nr:DUF2207 domain-containing protein [Alphaproteobacteria bacterium]